MLQRMGLTAGTKLGPYEIQSALGKGGMGEVYRALDTRLNRTVAVKVLPTHLSKDSEARQRFDREARTISSLNHPHICTLYDVGHQDGVDYLVMEYLEGETLADRLRRGPLPLDQVLRYGSDICEGLERAHRGGVAHRDLKPGNIMLTKEGAKLMDFGLAKPLVVRAESSSSLTVTMSTPVGSHPLTAEGMVVGTFQYMAPEQVEGKEADARSDIFALGAVLYEMLTGKRAFEGKTATSAMAAVLERNPVPVSSLQPMATGALDHLVQQCLAKDPEKRWQSAADAGLELRWIATGGSGANAPQISAPGRNWRGHFMWAALSTVLILALGWSLLRAPQAARTMRTFLPPPGQMSFDFTGDFSGPPVISRDGTAVAFCARTMKERSAVYVEALNELSAKKLDGTEGASFPFWSADGKNIGFFADGHLKRVLAEGGPVTILADAPNPRGGAWNADNVIIYEPDYRETLWRINASGGTPTRLTQFDVAKHTTHRWPQFLPDGKHFLFFATTHSGEAEHGIYFGSLEDGSYKHVIDADSNGQYASGYLLYHIQSQLQAMRFDPVEGTISGEPLTVANLVENDIGTWHTTFSASDTGLLLYEPGSKALGNDLFWMDRNGNTQGKVSERSFYKGAGRLSPDGKRLGIAMGDPQADIWVFDLANGSRTRLTFGGATHREPSWSTDGQRVVYITQNGPLASAGTSIRQRLASGGGQEETLLDGTPDSRATLLSPQFSADGQYLLYTSQSGPAPTGIFALPLRGEKKPITIVPPPAAPARLIQYRLSPDGQWLAYSSTETGREEIYVTHFPSGQGKWQVSQSGGTFPVWRGDSKELWFIGLDLMLHTASVGVRNGEFEVEAVRPMFQITYTSPIGMPYDVSADGKRLILTTFPESVPTPLVLVSNWTAELRK
jgi:eukaryotic-like serine/threonine-protein kinase